MRLLCLFMMCVFLQSCEKDKYYYSTFEGEREVSIPTLYENDRVRVSLQIFNGFVSSLQFSNLEKNVTLEIELLRFDHTLLVNDILYTPILMDGYELGSITFSENQWRSAIISETVMDSKPESLIESVVVEMLIDGNLVTISKEFKVIRGAYSHFDALMNM